MHQGYIKLWRRLKDSNFWLSEKFTKAQAWVDLLMLANHKPGFIRKRGIRVDLERGQMGWSERELSERWKWSRGKTRRFLSELCSEKESKMIPQIEPQKKNVTSKYNIVNYELYQDNSTANSTTDGPQTDRKQYQNKNDKNDKNKPIKKKIEYPGWLDLDIWNEFKKYRTQIKAPLTDHAQKLLIADLKKLKDDNENIDDVINQTIKSGKWKGFYPVNKKTGPKNFYADLEKQSRKRFLDHKSRYEDVLDENGNPLP